MPISELVAVGASMDEAFRCPLGDAAAQRWGRDSAVFIRSSASHVFVAAPRMGKRVVLRMRPDTQPGARAVLTWSAQAAAALKNAGAPVAGSVPSDRGDLVELVDGYLVTALEAVEGDLRDSDALDERSARTWGTLLADLHARGSGVVLTSAPPNYAATVAPDVPADLPRTPDVYGLLHGDPEIDNLVWTNTKAAFVDFDDVHHGWYAADVAFALRDWAATAAAPDLSLPIPAAFIDGYQQRRPFTDEEKSWLPLLARISAAETLARLQPVLSEPVADGWPPWAHALHRRVREEAEQLRRALA